MPTKVTIYAKDLAQAADLVAYAVNAGAAVTEMVEAEKLTANGAATKKRTMRSSGALWAINTEARHTFGKSTIRERGRQHLVEAYPDGKMFTRIEAIALLRKKLKSEQKAKSTFSALRENHMLTAIATE